MKFHQLIAKINIKFFSMLKSKGKHQKIYKTDWTIKNIADWTTKDDDKIRKESKKLDIKVGSNSTKW
jgi:hypothetical protein